MEESQISDKHNEYFIEHLCTFMISHSLLLRMRNFSEKGVDKIKTHILCSVTFSRNRAVYEVMWKNTVEPDRPASGGNVIRHMRCACWIPKAADTHCFSTATVVVTRTHLSVNFIPTLSVLFCSCF